jgi:malate dehydrogenase (oxaloacetate-decarboxylating)
MLDAQARGYTEDMALAAARAIAGVVGDEALNASVIVPSVFDARVAPSVAAAVRAVAKGTPPAEAAAAASTAVSANMAAAPVLGINIDGGY